MCSRRLARESVGRFVRQVPSFLAQCFRDSWPGADPAAYPAGDVFNLVACQMAFCRRVRVLIRRASDVRRYVAQDADTWSRNFEKKYFRRRTIVRPIPFDRARRDLSIGAIKIFVII